MCVCIYTRTYKYIYIYIYMYIYAIGLFRLVARILNIREEQKIDLCTFQFNPSTVVILQLHAFPLENFPLLLIVYVVVCTIKTTDKR